MDAATCHGVYRDARDVGLHRGHDNNLLFMNILLITIPPLIMFLFFNRQIVAGMTAGAIKG